MDAVGVSAMAIAVPGPRVELADLCRWRAEARGVVDAAALAGEVEKTHAVVGSSFRMADRDESVYTLAANAVLRLIDQADVDPRTVGYLALGTESSTDNAAGAVIVRGLVDRALREQGRPTLSRSCEVPEIKHACLGGIYGLKGALRYVATDGRGRRAIVVSADLAEYARGSSGEPTQGAGAVAMLVEASPRLFAVDLAATGSSSAYREVDFRKPIRRYAKTPVRAEGRVHDVPVFNGKYSTTCYTDAVIRATEDLAARRGETLGQLMAGVDVAFLHRPYAKMPVDGLSAIHAASLGADELAALGVDAQAVAQELTDLRDLRDEKVRERIDAEAWPALAAAVKALRGTAHAERIKARLTLGSVRMRALGNLYTAALPAWLAAGFTEAAERGVALEGRRILAVGYGSGDAAEALVLEAVPGWEAAARAIAFDAALTPAVTLTRAQYEALHDTGDAGKLGYPRHGFVVERIGTTDTAAFSDLGVEYHRWLGTAEQPHG